MTFKAMVRCDAEGCCEESELECFDPADAEDAIFELSDWFTAAGKHYCPAHAEAAKQKWEEENPRRNGIYQTMVG
ncbi:hypothetical protein AAFX60_018600 [Aliivibrio fischeri]